MIRELGGVRPRIAESVYLDESAIVIGDVEIGEGCSIWPGAVIRGDFGLIRVGKNTNIQDNCIVHAEVGIGNDVTIGHGAVVHCKRIGNNVLVGINATLLDDVEIEDYCLIAAGAVVSVGSKIPSYSFVAGVPAKVRELKENWIEHLKVASKIYTDLVMKYKGEGM